MELMAKEVDITPIASPIVQTSDTRFGTAEQFMRDMERISGRAPIKTVVEAEPIGPKALFDALVIAPCTGNTLAKIANGITDTAVTMAAKAHLRCDRPLLIALASNDAMSQNLGNIAKLLTRKSVYFVPLSQDDPIGKPHSLVADFSRLGDAFSKMREGKQLRPLFL